MKVPEIDPSDPFACAVCQISFKFGKYFFEHVKLNHSSFLPDNWKELEKYTGCRFKSNKGEKIKCEFCEMTFKRIYELKLHIREHRGDKPFKCQHCGKGFARQPSATKHENKSCPNKENTGQVQLGNEMNVHKGSVHVIIKQFYVSKLPIVFL